MATAGSVFDEIASYEDRGVNRERMAAVERHAGPSLVDVGCGSGAYITTLPANRPAFGLDSHRFPTWSRRPGQFGVADAAVLPLRDDSVDTVLCFETLEHLPDPLAAVREYHRVCRNNLILTVPNCTITPGMRASNLIFHHWIDPTHRNFFDPPAIEALVTDGGFEVVETGLINAIALGPLVTEALRLPRPLRRGASAAINRWQRRYAMTTLVVARKLPHVQPRAGSSSV